MHQDRWDAMVGGNKKTSKELRVGMNWSWSKRRIGGGGDGAIKEKLAANGQASIFEVHLVAPEQQREMYSCWELDIEYCR